MARKLSLLAGALWACLAVTAQAATGTLTWEPVTQYEDGTAITTPVTYRVWYRGPADTAPRVIATATAPNRGVSYTGAGQHCWFVTAVADGQESVPPANACRTIEARPKAPANLVITP